MKPWLVLLLFLEAILPGVCVAAERPPADLEDAIDLVHAFNGSGNELERAMTIARNLAKSHPNRGYSETIQAEILSTWNLQQNGEPKATFDQVMFLTDQASRLNPGLAYAHVPRARALLRASRFEDARAATDEALKLDPKLAGAIFLRAEIFRRTMQPAEAETWYLMFIERTASETRKSNAYFWLGKSYQEAAWTQPRQWDLLISKARGAYEKMLELDPGGPWKNVNFAIFLNDEAGDFVSAERYAQVALNIMEFPMARYHLAIARYQKLQVSMATMSDGALKEEVGKIARSTRISLEDAIKFAESYRAIPVRLNRLRDRLLRRTK
jgi:tetratricopeptide (TPR) repeat protein